MNALLLTAAGLLFAVLFLLNIILKTAAGAKRVGFIDLLLLFVTVSLLILSQVHNTIEAPPSLPFLPLLVTVPNIGRVVALLFIIIGTLVILFESRREEKLRGSRGVMSLWGGVLVLVTTFTAPAISTNFSFEPGGITLVAADGSVIVFETEATEDPNAPSATPTAPSPTPTVTPTFTPTASRTPRPTPSATPTREPIIVVSPTPTESPAEAASAECVVEVTFDLRMRLFPQSDAEVVAYIPLDTIVSAEGRSSDSVWLYIEYEGERGWIPAEFTSTTPACADLPAQPQ